MRMKVLTWTLTVATVVICSSLADERVMKRGGAEIGPCESIFLFVAPDPPPNRLPELTLRGLFFSAISMSVITLVLAAYVALQYRGQRQQEGEGERKTWWTQVKKVLHILLVMTEMTEFYIVTVLAVGVEVSLKGMRFFPCFFLIDTWFFVRVENIFMGVSTMEFLVKVVVLLYRFFVNPWNDTDFISFSMKFVEVVMALVQSVGIIRREEKPGSFSFRKTLKGSRMIRAVHLAKAKLSLNQLRLSLASAAKSPHSVRSTSVVMLMGLDSVIDPGLLVVFFCTLYHQSDPWRFGMTLITLLQVLKVDGWKIYGTVTDRGAAYVSAVLLSIIIAEGSQKVDLQKYFSAMINVRKKKRLTENNPKSVPIEDLSL